MKDKLEAAKIEAYLTAMLLIVEDGIRDTMLATNNEDISSRVKDIELTIEDLLTIIYELKD